MTNLTTLTEHLSDLYELFAKMPKLHILRATDQALKCRWKLSLECWQIAPLSNEDTKRCMKQRESQLGTKAQLAMHLIKNLDKFDKIKT